MNGLEWAKKHGIKYRIQEIGINPEWNSHGNQWQMHHFQIDLWNKYLPNTDTPDVVTYYCSVDRFTLEKYAFSEDNLRKLVFATLHFNLAQDLRFADSGYAKLHDDLKPATVSKEQFEDLVYYARRDLTKFKKHIGKEALDDMRNVDVLGANIRSFGD